MCSLPKLRIKLPSQHVPEDICELEQARHRFNWGHEPFLIVVEGQVISTYEKLKELAEQVSMKDKEYLEVDLEPILIGG
jgi:hypothetical protein